MKRPPFQMDIEGSEFETLPELLDPGKPLFCQLLLEVHAKDAAPIAQLRSAVRAAGYAQFAAELNALGFAQDANAIVFGFIHRSCAGAYGVTPFAT